MQTRLPNSSQIHYEAYLDTYLRQPDALRRIPSDEELLALAHKSITREQMTLQPLPEGTAAQSGDTAVLKVSGSIPRFQKDKVTVTLGRGLYNRELENALIGHKVSETVAVVVQGQPVEAQILELKRKQVPEPTDEMVQELQAKDFQGNSIKTVAEYEAYIKQEKTMEVLATINYYVVEKILADYADIAYEDEDLRILGELERAYFIKIFQDQEGIDLREEIPESWEKEGIHSLDDFIAARRDWYKIKIQQCLIFLNILGLPCEGKTDPLDHYEVLSELQLKMFDLLKEALERRNNE